MAFHARSWLDLGFEKIGFCLPCWCQKTVSLGFPQESRICGQEKPHAELQRPFWSLLHMAVTECTCPAASMTHPHFQISNLTPHFQNFKTQISAKLQTLLNGIKLCYCKHRQWPRNKPDLATEDCTIWIVSELMAGASSKTGGQSNEEICISPGYEHLSHCTSDV